MTLTVAIQMDPIETINIDTDSTFMMALEAQRRGYTLFHYLPRNLSLRNGRLTARAQELRVQRQYGSHFTLGAPQVLDLSTVDIILLRQDPPFDLAYITSTHLLEHVSSKVLVVNNPVHVRNAPEKLLVTHFPELAPPTLITNDRVEILEFRAEHKDIIVKPLFGAGGSGVFHLKPDDENLSSVLEMFAQLYREPLIVQKYLPEIRQGDKRIILFDGEAVGGVLRMPQEGEARANFHSGGKARKTELSARELEICATIGPELKSKGLIFVGIDVIGSYLTEINVTSPTGIQEINRLNETQLEIKLWDAINARLK
ncbi:Glutathione synthetase [Azospirillaceae bacterium]